MELIVTSRSQKSKENYGVKGNDSGKRRPLIFIVFFVVLLWSILLFQGLPIGDPDDWEHVLVSGDASGNILAKNFLLPWSTSKHWVGQIDLPDRTFSKRLFHTIVLKGARYFFDYQPFPHYLILKGTFFAGTSAFLFLLLLKITRSLLFSVLGLAFFIAVPAHYASVLWISDATTLIQFFLMVGLYAFLNCLPHLEAKGSTLRFLGWTGLLLICSWTAVKTKETAVILPFSLMVYMISEVGRLKTSSFKWLILFFLLGLVAFQVVPIGHLFDEGQQRFTFQFETMKRLLFRNYATGYEDEPTSTFFSLEHVWPVSIARTFGFFALWLLVILSLTTLARILYLKAVERSDKPMFFSPLTKIAIVWIAIESVLFGFFIPDPRYFSTIMIPITLFIFKFLEFATGLWSSGWQRLLLIAIIGAFACTLFANVQHIIWLRLQIGQRTSRFLNVAKIIYQDLFPNEPLNMRKIGLFFCPSYIPSDSGPRLKGLTYYVALGYGQWNRTETPELNDFLRLAPKGTPFIATYDDRKFQHRSVEKIGTINGINDSAFEKILYRLKKNKPDSMYVFRYTP